MVRASTEADIMRISLGAAVDQAYEALDDLPQDSASQTTRATAWRGLAEMWANAEYWAAIRLQELRNLETAIGNWQSWDCNADVAKLTELDSLLTLGNGDADDATHIYSVEHITRLRNRLLLDELTEAERELTKYRTWHREAVVWAYALGSEFWE